jgi:S-adenosylmethionine hydrolase
MKAVVLSFSGYDTPLFDLTHSVEPGNIMQGAFHLFSSLPRLPEGSVTLAVVDPGVGSSRQGLAALWQGRFVVAPDNGLITLLNSPEKVWKLPDPALGSSHTFHGRDVFAPAAARLLVDPGWTSYLEPIGRPVALQHPEAVTSGNKLTAAVLHIDNFGNCITCITEDDLKGFTPVKLSTDSGGILLCSVVSYYQAEHPGMLLILKGSQGFYELAVAGGSAADRLGLHPGDSITLHGN